MSAIKKEVIIGDCRLILGDCMEVMPSLGEFDAVITDPPYGVSIASFKDWDSHPLIDWIDFLPDILVNGASILVFGSKNFTFLAETKLRENFDFRNRYVWLKNSSGFVYSEKYATTKHEDILFFSNGDGYFFDAYETGELISWHKSGDNGQSTSFSRGSRGSYQSKETRRVTTVFEGKVKSSLPLSERTPHPSQKPLNVLEVLCNVHSPGQARILDPFMGSGTTLVACAKTGRKGTGIELDPEYFEIACERVRKAYEQPDIFIEAEKQPELVQGDML